MKHLDINGSYNRLELYALGNDKLITIRQLQLGDACKLYLSKKNFSQEERKKIKKLANYISFGKRIALLFRYVSFNKLYMLQIGLWNCFAAGLTWPAISLFIHWKNGWILHQMDRFLFFGVPIITGPLAVLSILVYIMIEDNFFFCSRPGICGHWICSEYRRNKVYFL